MSKTAVDLRAPFPWFGGKSRIAGEVWRRFGRVRNYVEPFCGSCAILLGRPQPFDGTETVNDMNGWLCNFWRALQADPDGVAHWADWPVSELDLHAQGDWLFYRSGVAEFIERMRNDPEYYDVKLAGWWVWGLCSWIGCNWSRGSHDAKRDKEGNAIAVTKARPHLNMGHGVNRKLPHLGDAGRGDVEAPPFETTRTEWLRVYLRGLAGRLRNVRVCCGDWTRVCGPTPTILLGLTAVFLDPPYAVEDRDTVYGEEDSRIVATAVREWCLQQGGNPKMRIALCGYEGEHAMPADWTCLAWKTGGGYASQSSHRNDNAKRERIWFSPACLKSGKTQRELFAEAGRKTE